MQVSQSAEGDIGAIMNSKLQKTAGDVSVAVAKKTMDMQKVQSAQVVDMIKKAGGSIDVTA